MGSVLVQLIHPAFERSRVGRALFDAAAKLAEESESLVLRDLYEEYPDFLIDVEREKELLAAHDTIVFLHPFYWYSSPALLKEWQDLVLEYGFAYGPGGTALHGKRWWSVFSAGGDKRAYCAEGSNRYDVRTLVTPFQQTAQLCGMEFLTPFVVFGANRLRPGPELDATAAEFAGFLARLRDSNEVPSELRAPGVVVGHRGEQTT